MGQRDLGVEAWRGVIESLEEFMPYYERVNYAVTLLQLPLWRARVAKAVRPGEEVLEIGPGPGGFAKLLPGSRVYLLEPSTAILRYSVERLRDRRYIPLLGLAEGIPLKESSLDKVFCIFSFRDFMDKRRALDEALRVLRRGGELHIVDLFLPAGRWGRLLMELWLEWGAGALLRLLVPRRVVRDWRRDPYRELLLTFRAVGTVGEYEELMRDVGFTSVEQRQLLPGSVHHLRGVKSSTM